MDLTEYDDSGSLREEVYNYFNNISENYDDVFFRKVNYSEICAKLAVDDYLKTNTME